MTAGRISKAQLQQDIRTLSDLLKRPDNVMEATRFVVEHPHVAQQRCWYSRGDTHARKTGTPFLNLAARMDLPACVEALVEAGAPLEGRSPDGRTPLLEAIDAGPVARLGDRRRIYDHLIAKGARADVVDDTGESPIYHCCGDLDIEVARDLVRRGTPLDSWSIKEAEDRVPSITRLAGVCLNLPHRRETLQLLIRCGVDLNPPIQRIAEHPLATVLGHGETTLAELMVEHGARWQIRAPDGKSLMFAAGSPSAVQWLLGKDPGLLEQPDRRGRTPLMWHLQHLLDLSTETNQPSTDLVCSLIVAGANLDAVDEQGPGLCPTPCQAIASGKHRGLKDFLRPFQAARAAAAALDNLKPDGAAQP